MKPIKLVMSGFGSYAETETVSFEKYTHGIFLITGDTGAGKTTIFDAITFALYDQTSGGVRKGDMMRSHFASPKTPTYVELTFIYEGLIYTIKRNPSYSRPSSRKNKEGIYTMTTESSSVELTMPDGRMFNGKSRETNKKIVEIIGLDANQFTQIAMIAQGDFLKMLHAPSKDRKEIFGKIFDTKIYGRIQDELKFKAKKLGGLLADNKARCIQEMERITCVEGSELLEVWEEEKGFSEVNPESVLDIIRQLINEAKDKELAYNKEMSANQNLLEGLNSKIDAANVINELFEKLEVVQSEINELKGQEDNYIKLKDQLDLSKKAIKVKHKEDDYSQKANYHIDTLKRISSCELEISQFVSELKILKDDKKSKEELLTSLNHKNSPLITRIEDALPKYDLLKEEIQLEVMAKKDETQLENKYNLLTEKMTLTEAEISKLELEQVSLSTSSEALVKIESDIHKLEENQKYLVDMDELASGLRLLNSKLNVSRKEIEKRLEIFKTSNSQYEVIYSKYIAEQVGIIAKSLEDGKPCPVCGAKEHPIKAVLSSEEISQVAVEEAKLNRENAEKALKEIQEEFKELKSSYDLKVNTIEQNGKRIISEDFIANEEGLGEIKVQLQHCNSKLSINKNKYSSVEKENNKYKKNTELLLQLNNNIKRDSKAQKDMLNALTKARKISVSKQSQVKALQETLPYKSKEEATFELQQLKDQLDKVKTEASLINQKYNEQENEKEKAEGGLKTLKDLEIRQKKDEKVAKNVFDLEIVSQGFSGIELYKANLKDEAIMNNMENDYKTYIDRKLRAEANLSIYKEQTEGKEKINTLELKDKKLELEKISQKLNVVLRDLYAIKTNNQSVERYLTSKFSERTQLIDDYSLVSRLDKTANGSLAGSTKLDFQTYIQRRYFQNIIHEANKRLHIMSSEQFILKCRDIENLGSQGEVGLDLDVYSLITDKSRDVKTLSGGESFMASLAMALGMSDVIQHTAGKVHLDTMFIDEGFGSLDEETREQAIRILNTLAEGKRLVGIISHVSELKDRIEQKLVVTKDEKGSRIQWANGDYV